jgi:phenylalanyl-tRNA synthetase beta chain
MTIGSLNPETEVEDKLRSSLVSAGFNEVTTWTLTNEETDKKALIYDSGVEIKNPRTNEFTRFRTDLVPSMLSTIAVNKTRGLPQMLFEIGRVADMKGACSTRLCCAITSDHASFSDIAGVFNLVGDAVGARIEPVDAGKEFLIPGRSVKFVRDSSKKGEQEVAGWCGEIHPQALENFGIEYPVAAFEISLPIIAAPKKASRSRKKK